MVNERVPFLMDDAILPPDMSFGFLSRVSGWRVARWVFLGMCVALVTWFCVIFGRYYRAILAGEVNPLLDQQLQASVSHQLANAHVTEEDLIRLQPPSAPAFGNPAAKVVVVEFLDFGCPYSRDSFSVVREVMEKYKDRVYFIARDFPIDELHPRATSAALAGRCAQEQKLYWPYHDKLFGNQEHQEDEDLRRYAQEVGLSLPSFDACIKDKRYMERIQADSADGLRAGVEGTPTFFLNGVRIPGSFDARTFEFLLKQFLERPQ